MANILKEILIPFKKVDNRSEAVKQFDEDYIEWNQKSKDIEYRRQKLAEAQNATKLSWHPEYVYSVTGTAQFASSTEVRLYAYEEFTLYLEKGDCRNIHFSKCDSLFNLYGYKLMEFKTDELKKILTYSDRAAVVGEQIKHPNAEQYKKEIIAEKWASEIERSDCKLDISDLLDSNATTSLREPPLEEDQSLSNSNSRSDDVLIEAHTARTKWRLSMPIESNELINLFSDKLSLASSQTEIQEVQQEYQLIKQLI